MTTGAVGGRGERPRVELQLVAQCGATASLEGSGIYGDGRPRPSQFTHHLRRVAGHHGAGWHVLRHDTPSVHHGARADGAPLHHERLHADKHVVLNDNGRGVGQGIGARPGAEGELVDQPDAAAAVPLQDGPPEDLSGAAPGVPGPREL